MIVDPEQARLDLCCVLCVILHVLILTKKAGRGMAIGDGKLLK